MEMKQEFRTEPGAQLTRYWLDKPGAQLTRYWLDELLTLPLTKSRLGFNSWDSAELHMSLHGLSPGLSLNSGKDTRQMAKHHPHQSSRGSQPTFFFFFLTISSLFTRCFNYLKFTGPNSSGSSSKSVSFSKSSKSESLLHSWHFLYLVLSCFSLHISPWVAFKLLAKWALASPEPSTAPAQPKIWTHI